MDIHSSVFILYVYEERKRERERKTKSGIRISNKDPKQKHTAWRRCRPWLTHTDYSDGRTGEALALFPE